MEEPRAFTWQEPTLNGGRSSPIKKNTSSIGRTANALMLKEAKMLKVEMLSFGTDTMELTRDGKSSMLTKHQRFQQKVLMSNSDSTSTDHSTSNQECHSIELLRHMETTTSITEDGSRTRHNKCGHSTVLIRQSTTETGRTIALKLNPAEKVLGY
jgi:hypothetical protein